MRATNESSLALAGELRLLSDAQLSALIEAREIGDAGIRDFFDLGDALLESDSIAHALARLDRATLAVLSRASDAPVAAADLDQSTISRFERAVALALASETSALTGAATSTAASAAAETAIGAAGDRFFTVLSPVADHLARWPQLGLPSADELETQRAPTVLAAVSSLEPAAIDSLAAEQAFGNTTAVAELIAELRQESARELARGGMALPDNKRLAAAMGVELNEVAELVELAERAGLVARESGRWRTSDAAGRWAGATSGARWGLLAEAWAVRLPDDIREILASRLGVAWGEQLKDYVNWLFPAGGEWMHHRLATYTRTAEALGITARLVPSAPGRALFADGVEAAITMMTALFPAEVESVYLQHDLSIVSPGPLAPAIDARLRGIADVEGRALASRYRISTPSVYRALATGETEESIRQFLGEIAIAGIPQPLDYLLSEAASRYGLVRVGATPDGRSYVRSSDVGLLRTLHVDQALNSLGLTVDGTRLLSRIDRDVVFWAISDARYPVAAEDAAAEVEHIGRREAAAPAIAPRTSPRVALIEKLRVGSSGDPEVTGKAWLSRQLDVAIRGKLAITVTVQLPDGSSANYQLEPASVGGGRLRAKDRKSDIERTLPLASITAVGPAL